VSTKSCPSSLSMVSSHTFSVVCICSMVFGYV
jgi:hypothetical protein